MRPGVLFPHHDFVIETSWSPAVAAIEIRKRIAAPDAGSPSYEPFVGRSYSTTEFRFTRAYSGKNNVLPVILATVAPSHREGARLEISMRPGAAFWAFMVGWMAMATFGVIGSVRSRDAEYIGLFALCAMLMVVAAAHHFAFRREVRQTDATLRSIFAPAPPLPAPRDTGEPYR
jgi:hypothetical protein